MVNITFVPRADWNAVPSTSLEKMSHPIEHVNFSICNLTDPCSTKDECNYRVKQIQNHYRDIGRPDMIYNFVIGNDGNVYEGLGWDYKPLPESKESGDPIQDKTIDIGVICGYEEMNPKSEEMIALAFRKATELVRYGVENKLISENHTRHGFPEEVIDIDDPEYHKEDDGDHGIEFEGDIEY